MRPSTRVACLACASSNHTVRGCWDIRAVAFWRQRAAVRRIDAAVGRCEGGHSADVAEAESDAKRYDRRADDIEHRNRAAQHKKKVGGPLRQARTGDAADYVIELVRTQQVACTDDVPVTPSDD